MVLEGMKPRKEEYFIGIWGRKGEKNERQPWRGLKHVYFTQAVLLCLAGISLKVRKSVMKRQKDCHFTGIAKFGAMSHAGMCGHPHLEK